MENSKFILFYNRKGVYLIVEGIFEISHDRKGIRYEKNFCQLLRIC